MLQQRIDDARNEHKKIQALPNGRMIRPVRREHCPYGARKISRTLSRTGAVQDIKFHLHTLIQQRQNSQPPNP
ncbi:MAG: hypothetical protein IGS54_23060 [Elainella sp. C42_A2020_010]|nr:hypothetical protein [Elainella sp. C42_A2020_010]